MVLLLASEVQQLLHNKFVVVLGDSVQRSVYKDLVLLLQKDRLLTNKQLKTKGELSFEKDQLVAGGQLGIMHNGTKYREERQFCSGSHLVHFYFLTRVYSKYVERILHNLWSGEHTPDVIIMNSCLWDLSRYGRNSWKSYLKNLENLFKRLGQVLPESCLLVWNTAMPIGDKITARFLPPKGQYRPSMATLKTNLIQANFYSCAEARKHLFDVLDLHFHFRHARKHLQKDGVHWNEYAHRQLSQLLLAHVADAWGVDLPSRDDGPDEGPAAWEKPGQVENWGPPNRRDHQAFPQAPPWSFPRPRPLLPTPLLPSRPPPPLPPPIPLCQVRPLLPPCPQDAYFSSDHIFQSDEFYFHSDEPSPIHPGFAFEGDFRFGPQPPMPSFGSPCYQRSAPMVHRGFPRYLAHGPYKPWRGRSRGPRRCPQPTQC
uniref:PC-esterase domain-containing protein 1B n=1 Tax=Jaculus jaculus TaxID=51337 RepID=UPI0003334BA9|nr:PC-esterase domain-containing protein 1B [Jaculus jaculus]XP_045009160.1 PC-esterase domain-containing protein 1B [Jaculus jaculus]XP_045009161.1 PC-esterase domain-containing protein 1B [Jaculus jaculus]XP_045009162.1 PC-esterase domain-containing protein 1B [Jaculus jaculus]